MIKAAQDGYAAAHAAYQTDTITLEELCNWSLRWLAAEETAERVVASERMTDRGQVVIEESVRDPGTQDRIVAVRNHIKRMQELQTRVNALYQAGTRGGEAERKALMDYYVADADRRLAQIGRCTTGAAGRRHWPAASQTTGCNLQGAFASLFHAGRVCAALQRFRREGRGRPCEGGATAAQASERKRGRTQERTRNVAHPGTDHGGTGAQISKR